MARPGKLSPPPVVARRGIALARTISSAPLADAQAVRCFSDRIARPNPTKKSVLTHSPRALLLLLLRPPQDLASRAQRGHRSLHAREHNGGEETIPPAPPRPPPTPSCGSPPKQVLFDHWLLVEMRGGDPALTSQKLLVLSCGLRARLNSLLAGALEEAERRRGAGSGGGFGRAPGQDPFRRDGTGAGQRGRGKGGGGEGLEDLPPLLRMARRAWEEGGGGGGGGGPYGPAHQPAVDWAREAEDLSAELADFMLQSIR